MIEDKNTEKTDLSTLGEFGLIEHLTKNFTIKHQSTIKGIGDDAAVLDFGTKKTIVTTDLLVEGVHFDLSYMPLKHLGYKSVIVNLSMTNCLLSPNSKVISPSSNSAEFSHLPISPEHPPPLSE